MAKPDTNAFYVTEAPSPQTVVDVFKGEWSSRFPASLQPLSAGRVPLFEDKRIHWFDAQVGGFRGKTVLELGPLEGGHSYMLSQLGAEHVTAVEANSNAYLRCLISKELLGMQNVSFLLGDFSQYLQGTDCPTVEVILASGVLYHMTEPLALLDAMASKAASAIALWTHYFDPDQLPRHARKRRLRTEWISSGDAHYEVLRYEYAEALGWKGFCGGSRRHARWMRKEDILAHLEHLGFGDIIVGSDEPDHSGGPALLMVARRQS